MQSAQDGDAVSYKKLLSEISPVIRNFLKSRLFSVDQADDLTQEILMAIHAVRHTYRPDQPFENWMFGIARHKLLDHFRRLMRKNSHEIADDELVTFMADPANTPEEALSGKELRIILGHLPERQRRIIIMTKMEGFSVSETAEKMNMTETAIKVTVHRGLKKLREILVTHGYE